MRLVLRKVHVLQSRVLNAADTEKDIEEEKATKLVNVQ